MTEDTVLSISQSDDLLSAEELLQKASDQSFLDYVSAYASLIKKKKYPGRTFYNAIMRDINRRTSNVQNKAREILNSAQKK